MSFFDGGFGALSGGILETAGSLIGSHQDRNFARAQANADRAFQREVFQNQLQWKAADAKKAGLHPLAALGGGAYSASPSSVSVPGSSLGDGLGKLGQGIGDAFSAYKTKKEKAVEEALAYARQLVADQREQETHDQSIRESASRIQLNNAQTAEAMRRAIYTIPMASGREFVPGQVNSHGPVVERNLPPAFDSKIGHTHQLHQRGHNRYSITLSEGFMQGLGDEWGQIYGLADALTRRALAEIQYALTGKATWEGMNFNGDGTWSFPE